MKTIEQNKSGPV